MWINSPRPGKTFHVERSASDDFNLLELRLSADSQAVFDDGKPGQSKLWFVRGNYADGFLAVSPPV